jgi:hypothetical protein
MALMRLLSSANSKLLQNSGRYAATLDELAGRSARSLDALKDAWGTPLRYERHQDREYELISYGCDGAPGPPPPPSWREGEECEADIVLSDGEFVQGPGINGM